MRKICFELNMTFYADKELKSERLSPMNRIIANIIVQFITELSIIFQFMFITIHNDYY